MAVVVYAPIESARPGFYVIPGFQRYAASRGGEIINIGSGHLKTFHILRGYWATRLTDDSDVSRIMFIHRLVALAFHGPQPENLPLVNHGDGVKWNNVPDNLQWTNYSSNIDHAYRNGLRSDNRPVLAKNLSNDEITRYHSLQECARSFGVTGERIWRNIRDNSGNVYFEQFVFRYEDDSRPWPVLGKDDIGKRKMGTAKAVIAKHIDTGKVTMADSATKLSMMINVKFTTICYALRTGRQYPCQGYLLKFEDDNTPWIH